MYYENKTNNEELNLIVKSYIDLYTERFVKRHLKLKQQMMHSWTPHDSEFGIKRNARHLAFSSRLSTIQI